MDIHTDKHECAVNLREGEKKHQINIPAIAIRIRQIYNLFIFSNISNRHDLDSLHDYTWKLSKGEG